MFYRLKLISSVILTITFISLISCQGKTDGKKDKNTEKLSFSDSIAASGRMAVAKPLTSDEIATYQKQGKSILEHRRKQNPKNWSILDVGVWEYEFIFKDGKMSKEGEHKGKWIDFDENNNYTYGNFENREGSGQYHYDNDSHLLLLVNNAENIKPEEYELKLVQNVMIMMGRNTYGSNPIQAKLFKSNSIPTKIK